MPARLVQVTIFNNSDYPIVWQDDGRNHGFWQEPWYPSNIKSLKKGEKASFRLESGGVMTGVEGWALFKVDVPVASNVGPTTEFFRLNFSRAYLQFEPFDGTIEYFRKDPRTNDADHPGAILAYVAERVVGNLDGYSTDLTELGSALVLPIAFPFVGLIEAFPLLANESIDKHVLWVVEVRNAGESRTLLPLKLPTKNLIYGVTPRVHTSEVAIDRKSSRAASGGDLMWYRHEGRLDGSFNWDGPEKVGNRWEGLKHVFSGGDGIVYAVTPRVDAAHRLSTTLESGGHVQSRMSPASGGDLLWYRHIGKEDGTFSWLGPKRVGIRWDGFKHLFSGGDGIIYGIQENGDLMWYRHVGYADGSFVWQGPQKVGIGWGELTQVFHGGDGIIYGVTPRVPAAVHMTGGTSPESGGDLMWYRHVGREDGTFDWNGPRKVGTRWDALERVFSDGAGIIYGVTPKVEASFGSGSMSTAALESGDDAQANFTPASGGELLWYLHRGREEGTFEWDGPRQVGVGWGDLEHLFSGGVSTA